MSADRIRAKVHAGLRRAGRRTGGAPVTATLHKAGTGTPAAWGGTGATQGTQYALTLVIGSYSARDRDGTNITAQDAKLLVSPLTDPAGAVVENDDTIVIDATGARYDVVSVSTVQPGAVALLRTVQGRASKQHGT